jgi:uncharacterized membrane protein
VAERTTAGRLVGIDLARCLALLGMVATHVLDSRGPDGGYPLAHEVAAGRASALFAVLAGVSLALMTGRTRPVRGRDRAARSAGLVVRALLIAVVGLLLGGLDSGIAVILSYYGVLFLLAVPFLGLGPRALLGAALVWGTVTPVVSHLLRPSLPERGYESPNLTQLAEPGQLLSELLWTGYYPAVPWLTYVLVGLAVGRSDLRRWRTLASLVAAGAVLAAGAAALSAALQDYPGNVPTYGTTPTGESAEWLLVAFPHSGTPFDLATTIGSAVLVLGLTLLVDHVPGVARRSVQLLAGAGAMTLTLYSLHVVMRTPAVPPAEVPDSFAVHVLVLLGIGLVYAALGSSGPLERLVTAASKGTAALVRAGPEPRQRRRSSLVE